MAVIFFAHLPRPAVFDRRLQHQHLRVLGYICLHGDGRRWCYLSQVQMAKLLGIRRATANEAINFLVSTGYIERRIHHRETGAQGANGYRLRLDLSDAEYATMEEAAKAEAFEGDAGEAAATIEGISSSPDGCSAAPPVRPSVQGGVRPSVQGLYAPAYSNVKEEDSKDTPLSPPAGGERDDRSISDRRRAAPADDPDFEAFYAAYPVKRGDGPVRARREWDGLSAAERKVAAGAVERVFQLRRATDAKWQPSAHTYLRNRAWVDTAPRAVTADGGAPARVAIRPFGRDFWIVFFRRVVSGGNWQWLVSQIDAFGGITVPAEEAPTTAQLDGFVAVLIRGADGRSTPEFAAWDQWFHERGVRLPRPQRAERIFMPARTPGEWQAAGGEGDASVAGIDEAGAVFDGR